MPSLSMFIKYGSPMSRMSGFELCSFHFFANVILIVLCDEKYIDTECIERTFGYVLILATGFQLMT